MGNRSWSGWPPGNSGSGALGGIDNLGALRVGLWPRRNALLPELVPFRRPAACRPFGTQVSGGHPFVAA